MNTLAVSPTSRGAISADIHLVDDPSSNSNTPKSKAPGHIKPPRLDIKKIAAMASHKTPEFSPLSANSSNRAALFLELATFLQSKKYLPSWYEPWISSKNVNLIRASSATIFQSLQDLERQRQELPAYTIREALKVAHAPLNRYADVSPYDHSRVLLSQKKQDYINASHISSPDKLKNYIATQGPLPKTFGDFWHMVWSLQTVTIVMLSKEEESGRLKCHRYWPDRLGDMKRYFVADELDAVCFRVVYSDECIMGDDNNTIVRELYITREKMFSDTIVGAGSPANHQIPHKHEMESRTIRIVHFKGWSDHDACDPRDLLSVIDIANQVNSADMNSTTDAQVQFKPGPMVIHCSAGIGRTGTFCTADTIFHDLILNGIDASVIDTSDEPLVLPQKDLVANTVNHFRRQRPGFVQTPAQLHLIYEVVLLKLSDMYQQSNNK